MTIVEELLRSEENGTISFGNHTLRVKAKVEDFKYGADLLKVKTCQEITKLEKNGMFLYESVPGTSVTQFKEMENGVVFFVEGSADAQITVGLADSAEYEVTVGGNAPQTMKTGMSGKLSLGVSLENMGEVSVSIIALS
jgi:hypothetical protein